MRVVEGKLVASGLKVGIVAARFNEFIVSKLVSGALDLSLIHIFTIIFKFIPNELLLLLARDNNIHTVNMINMFSNKRRGYQFAS